MSEYMGPADLLDDAGVVVDSVQVYLSYSVEPGSGLGSWTGRVGNAPDVADWFEVSAIRLPDGREGPISLRNINVSSGGGGSSRSAQIIGLSGPPPFDTD